MCDSISEQLSDIGFLAMSAAAKTDESDTNSVATVTAKKPSSKKTPSNAAPAKKAVSAAPPAPQPKPESAWRATPAGRIAWQSGKLVRFQIPAHARLVEDRAGFRLVVPVTEGLVLSISGPPAAVKAAYIANSCVQGSLRVMRSKRTPRQLDSIELTIGNPFGKAACELLLHRRSDVSPLDALHGWSKRVCGKIIHVRPLSSEPAAEAEQTVPDVMLAA